MTRLPVVGIDLDDVLADFIKTFMALAAIAYNIDPNARPTSWEWDGVKLPDGLTKKEMLDGVWAKITGAHNFWMGLDVIPDVDRLLVKELDHKARVYFPTAREQSAGLDVARQSAYWLYDNFGLDFPQVFVSKEKGPLAKALKYDYFIDDRPVNCLAIQDAVPTCKVFLQDANHNKAVDLSTSNGIPRIMSINDFAELVLQGV